MVKSDVRNREPKKITVVKPVARAGRSAVFFSLTKLFVTQVHHVRRALAAVRGTVPLCRKPLDCCNATCLGLPLACAVKYSPRKSE